MPPQRKKIWPSFAVALPYWLSAPKAVSNALQKAWLRSLPLNARLERKGIFFHLVHATPPNPHYGRLDPDADEWAVELEQINADVLLVGHSHGPHLVPSACVLYQHSVGGLKHPRSPEPAQR